MDKTTYSPQLLAPGNMTLSVGVGFVSAASYPFFLPYRLSKENVGTKASGRTPRILTVFFSTLIHVKDSCYDPETRTMRFHRGFRQLSSMFGIFDSLPSRTILSETIRLMDKTYPDEPIKTRPFEEIHFADKLADMWVRFTPEFVELLTRDVREVPLNALVALHRWPIETDLIILSGLYCPEDRPLLIPLSSLQAITPVSLRQKKGKLDQTVSRLNNIQHFWDYRFLKRGLSIVPLTTAKYTAAKYAVTLEPATPPTSEENDPDLTR